MPGKFRELKAGHCGWRGVVKLGVAEMSQR